MAKNTSILIGDHFNNFIGEQVRTGRFSSASDVVRAALRLFEDHERRKDRLIKALEEGENSGFVENFDRETFLAEMQKKYSAKK